MKEKTIELFDGVQLHILKTNKFKTNLLSAFILTDLTREDVTKNALIPAVLSRGTEKLPTMKEIAIKLEHMYGAILDASSDKIGDKQALQFYIDALSNEYTLDGEDILTECLNLLCDVILSPALENGMFKAEYVTQEKETIRELIQSKINDKASYSMNRAIEEMCVNEPYGLYKFGYVEDLEDITPEILYKQYLKVLSTAEIHIYVSGNVDEEYMEKVWKSRFQKINRNYIAKNDIKSEIMFEIPKTVNEIQNVAQGKLVLGYKLDNANLVDDMYPMIVYSAVLGGTASSKLFMNVREKQSLAYTVRSMYLKHKGILLVTAGIEIANYEEALEYIKKEIEDMSIGNISEEELKDAKVNLITAYKSFTDKQSAMINYYMGQRVLGIDDGLEASMEKINAVTKEDVINTAKRLKQQVTYFLYAKKD